MPAEIVNSVFCAQYWATFEVPSSDGRTKYRVTLAGGEGQAHCECKAWEFAPVDGKDCKHIREVWKEACLWNPQWHDGGPNTLQPVETYERKVPGEQCPACGGPVVPVRIAV